MYRGEFEVGSTKFTLDIEDTSGTFAWDFPAMVEVRYSSYFWLHQGAQGVTLSVRPSGTNLSKGQSQVSLRSVPDQSQVSPSLS